MKEIKEKPTERAPKSDSAGKIPKAALKKAWTETKEKSRAKLRESTSAQGDGDYTMANDTGGMVPIHPIPLSSKIPISPCSRVASLPASKSKNTGRGTPQSRSKPPAPTPPVSAV